MKRAAIIGTVLLPLAIGWPAPASAQKTGNDLLEFCQAAVRGFDGDISEDEWIKGSYCIGFVDGVVAMTNTAELPPDATFRERLKAICLPSGATTAQAVRIVTQYLEANPSQLHAPAGFLVIMALSGPFGCP